MNKIYCNEISIICPSPKGAKIAARLQQKLKAKLYIKQDNCNQVLEDEEISVIIGSEEVYIYGEDFKLSDITKEAMENSRGVVFISSIGIAVRAIAPFLKGKDKDPGVVVVDLSAKYSINILSGHLGGGNELTTKVSEILNSIPIITTASDNLGLVAPDVIAKRYKLMIDNLKTAKYIAALLIDGKTIGIKDDSNIIEIGKGYERVLELKEDCIWVTHNLFEMSNKNLQNTKILKLIKKDLVLGIGCKRGTSYEKLNKFICDSLIKFNLDIRAVSAIVSINIKANEVGIIELAKKINCIFKTYSKEEIQTVQDNYDKSEFVLKTLGVTAVCEPCVELEGANIIVGKIKHDGMTLAIGLRNHARA